MLLLLVAGIQRGPIIDQPGYGVEIPRPADSEPLVEQPGGGDLIERPELR